MRLAKLINEIIYFLGRVLLWIIFWPLGLWRSVRHSNRKRDIRIEKQTDRRHKEMLAAIAQARSNTQDL